MIHTITPFLQYIYVINVILNYVFVVKQTKCIFSLSIFKLKKLIKNVFIYVVYKYNIYFYHNVRWESIR